MEAHSPWILPISLASSHYWHGAFRRSYSSAGYGRTTMERHGALCWAWTEWPVGRSPVSSSMTDTVPEAPTKAVTLATILFLLGWIAPAVIARLRWDVPPIWSALAWGHTCAARGITAAICLCGRLMFAMPRSGGGTALHRIATGHHDRPAVDLRHHVRNLDISARVRPRAAHVRPSPPPRRGFRRRVSHRSVRDVSLPCGR